MSSLRMALKRSREEEEKKQNPPAKESSETQEKSKKPAKKKQKKTDTKKKNAKASKTKDTKASKSAKATKASKAKAVKVKAEKTKKSAKSKGLSLDDKIRAAVLKIVAKVDLEKMTMKALRPMIEKEVGVSLKEKRKTVKREVLAALQSATTGGGIHQAEKSGSVYSAELSKFLNGEVMKRTQASELVVQMPKQTESNLSVVSRLWQHIRENNLQNPEKKTEIVNDAVFKGIFKCERMSMFEMNKLLSQHIESKSKGKAKPQAKAKAKGKAGKGKATPNRNSAFHQPLKLSKDLEAVTGPGPLGRTDVVKRVWVYIRKHNLQNPENRREILTDDALAKVMGGESRLSMFHISKHIQKHLSPLK